MRFFCEDVHRVWQRWVQHGSEAISPEIKVILDLQQRPDEVHGMTKHDQGKSKPDGCAVGLGGLGSLDVAYKGLKTHVEKSMFLLAENEGTKCAVCTDHVGPNPGLVLVCPVPDCQAASHITCLSSRFLARDDPTEAVIPTEGSCPACKEVVQWMDLVKEMSLRTRGPKEVERLMKKPRGQKSRLAANDREIPVAAANRNDGTDDDDDLPASEEDAALELRMAGETCGGLSDDGWQYRVDEDDDIMSTTSKSSNISRVCLAASRCGSPIQSARSEVIIEESDWDYAEVLCLE